jgi:hypothetical protein
MSAANEFNVTVPITEVTLTKTYHGLSIISGSGQIVGRIQSFQPTAYARDGKHVYELNAFTFGRPVDYVPGIESGRQLNCERVEMWNDEFEIEFGASADVQRNGGIEWIDLCEQTRPFIVQEALFRGGSRYRTWEYLGCWLKAKTITGFQAEGDAKVIVTCDMAFIIRKAL